jgi:dipeptide/tripeptide permease
VRRSPYAVAFARAVRPRLGPPAHTEAPQPPRFAQAVGLLFAAVALAGFGSGLAVLGLAATALALAAAFLNAAFGFCLGCEMYLLIRRTFPEHPSNRASTPTEVSA